jgi:hypothetical protein
VQIGDRLLVPRARAGERVDPASRLGVGAPHRRGQTP